MKYRFAFKRPGVYGGAFPLGLLAQWPEGVAESKLYDDCHMNRIQMMDYYLGRRNGYGSLYTGRDPTRFGWNGSQFWYPLVTKWRIP